MPTIKDIAQYAGVSHGTVSNVLNKRGNVSAHKIQLVEQAARELGYVINAQAKKLRQGHSKNICVLLPHGNAKRYMDLFFGIHMEAKKEEYEVDIHFTEDYQYEEERLLEHIISKQPAAIVLISTFVKKSDVFPSEIPVIFVERRPVFMPSNGIYIGFDYYEAGREIAGECVKDGRKNVALFSENEYFSNGSDFVRGIKEVFEDEKIGYTNFQSIDSLTLNSAFELQCSDGNFDAIVSDCIERANLIQKIDCHFAKKRDIKFYTLSTKSVEWADEVKRYELNYKLCGKKIASMILEYEKAQSSDDKSADEKFFSDNKSADENIFSNDKSEDEKFLKLKNDGFLRYPDFKKRYDHEKINFLSLSSPTMKAIKYLLPDFEKRTGIKVNLVEATYDELFNSINQIDSQEDNLYDLIRIDMAWLTSFAKKIYRSYDMECEPYRSIRANFSDIFKEEYFKVDANAYVLPLDPSVQILYYRKDLFDNALIKREFYERCRRQLNIPENYREYDEIAAFFTKSLNPNSPTKYGNAQVYGAVAVAACDFLPRLREKGIDLFDKNGRISIQSKKVKEAFNEYFHAMKFSNRTTFAWWNQAMSMFSQGDIAMNVVFSNHASMMMLNSDSKIAGKVGFGPVPGRKPLLGGGVLGISKYSDKVEECEAFLKWLYNEKTAMTITSLGGYVNNRNLIHNQDILQLYPWVEGMEKAFVIGNRRDIVKSETSQRSSAVAALPKRGQSMALPDHFEFEKLLGEAVRSVVLGVQSIDDALSNMQKKLESLI